MEAAEFGSVGVVGELAAADAERLASAFEVKEFPVGSVLVREGDLPTKVYVLTEGTVTVHRNGVHVADLGAGDFCGELGVVSLQPRNATVIATTPVRAAVAMGWDLRDVLDAVPAVRAQLERIAAERVADE